jgi:translation initiation factor 2 alpha subunit (eIF-2alpha)
MLIYDMKHPFQFYNWDMPQIGENVIVKIISNDDGIVNAKLLEYDLSGLIIIREGSRKAYRKLKPLLAQKLIKI